ncbi:Type I Iterative PKS [Claviceps africana]|uniref:Type I Iterative PKS n=1 Tax=Claviceps africana TaxID=83212 RepID=A0A8K0J2F8_9HYPO|nr:Type I Iterative PKS [Claviceps africana]
MKLPTTELFLCGPQSRFPPPKEVNRLRHVLLRHKCLHQSLSATLKDLPGLLQQLVAADESLGGVEAVALIDSLARWLDSGESTLALDDDLLHAAALPLTVLLQTALYVHHLEKTTPLLPSFRQTLQSLQKYGVQGFCIGFLTAAAIALSETEELLAQHVAISLRLAMCIGIYVDKNTLAADPPSPVFVVSVRWRTGQFSETQMSNILRAYKHAYISCITDATSVTVTAQCSDEKRLTNVLLEAGLRVTPISIRGRFHSQSHHAGSAEKLKEFSRSVAGLQYPLASRLQVPLRTNATGDLVTGNASLADVAIESILLQKADWKTTVDKTLGAFPTDRLEITVFAFEDGFLPAGLGQQDKIVPLVNGARHKTGGKPRTGNEGPRDAEYPPDSVAIVGMACRFPGANDPDEFWTLIRSGISMVTDVPSDRLHVNNSRLAGLPDIKTWGNFIEDADSFDHRFFKKSSREAASWGLEKRIMLQVAYQALESAGHFRPGASKLPSDYGCYIGAVSSNYYDNVGCHPPNAYSVIGTSRGFFSGRVSHQFGLTGPAMTIDSACSSSLVAINTACRAIQSGECSRAIAGATNVFSSPYDYQNLAAAGFLSPSGACKPFDAAADGYCRGEGVAAVVLKSLSAAMEEGDHILGVIVGSAVRQNYNHAHITAPCSSSQTEVYGKVLNMAGASPHSVTYVEAHGTGTPVGDPIECQSIREAFGGSHRKEVLHFGSVKGNIGHTEASAGVAGLIKVLLMMQHGTIPGQPGFNTLNPKIPALEPDMMRIATDPKPWHASSKIACVNSYGAAGSIAAVAVREAPPVSPTMPRQRPRPTGEQPIYLSAASETSLIEYCRKLLIFVEAQKSCSVHHAHLLADILFNLADRSNHDLTYSCTGTVKNLEDVEGLLRRVISGSEVPVKDTGAKSQRPVIMVFAGQETDFVGLSKEMVDLSDRLQFHLDECDEQVGLLGHGSLYPAIYERESIRSMPILHAALFAVQYATAMTWIDNGLPVSCLVGHSFGQLTSLCISGSLSLRDAMRLVVGRAELIESSWGEERGSMVSILAPYAVVQGILDRLNSTSSSDTLEIACFNHPSNHVVVGTANAVGRLERHIAGNDTLRETVRVKRLGVTHGFHSALTKSILPELEKLANSLEWEKQTIPVELTTQEAVDREPGAWLIPQHTRRAVHFSHAVQRITEKFPSCVWVEAGQGSSIMSLVMKTCLAQDAQQQLYCPLLLKDSNQSAASTSLAKTVVELWKGRVPVQFWPHHRSQRGRFEYKSLPPYQFEKTRHWLPFVDHVAPTPASAQAEPETPAKATHEFISFLEFADPSKKEAVFLVDPESERYMYLVNGHVASNQALAPTSLYIELLSRAAILLKDGASFDTHVLGLNSLRLGGSRIGLDPTKSIHVKLTRISDDTDSWAFECSSRPKDGGGNVQVHAVGQVGLSRRDDPVLADTFQRWSALIGYTRCLSLINNEDAESMRGKHLYQALRKLVCYDDMYRGMKSISFCGHEAAGQVAAKLNPRLSPGEGLYDTPVIDSMMQFAGVLVKWFAHPGDKEVLLSQGIDRVMTSGSFDITAGQWIAYSLLTEDTEHRTVCDVYVFEKTSQKVVIAFLGFTFTRRKVVPVSQRLPSSDYPARPVPPARSPSLLDVKPVPAPGTCADPSVDASVNASSRASEVLQVLHNVTDVPLDEITPDMSLEQLGIDSLLVTEVLNELQSTVGIHMDMNTFLFLPNVEAVCRHVDSALGVAAANASINGPDLPAAITAIDDDAAQRGGATPGPPPSQSMDSRPSLQRVQKVFQDCKGAYERAAVETNAVGFWTKCYPRQAALVLAHVVETFAKLGCDLTALRAGDALGRIPHIPRHGQLVRQLHLVLEDAKLIHANDQNQFIRTERAADPTPASALYRDIMAAFPLDASLHRVVQAVGSQLAECLTGDKDGRQIVFGDKDNKKALEDFYEHWPLLRSGSLALGEFLAKAMASRDAPGNFRILEVGAGTGGTTKHLVRRLQGLGIPFEYVFTDLSPSLVSAAKRTFRDCPEMEFATLDIERDPPASWLGSFHFVVSTNCVHATRNLTASLTSLRRMLRDDGALALVELTRNMFCLDIAVGLFEGWWLFDDGREHAITHETIWRRDMLRAGFRAVDWTDGAEPESATVRVIAGFPTDASR